MEKIINYLSNKLIMNQIILEDDRDIYIYGIRQTLLIVLNVMTVVLLGIIFNHLTHLLIFMFSYIPLRSFAGGYHAKSQGKCYVYSVMINIFVVIIGKNMDLDLIKIVIAITISSLILIIIAPVEAKNKPLDGVEEKVFAKKTRAILFIEIVIIGLLAVIGKDKYMIDIALSIIITAIMVVLGKWNLRKQR